MRFLQDCPDLSKAASVFLALAMLTSAAAARAGTDPCAVNALPPTLPLNGMVIANTCPANENPPCNSADYSSPTSTALLTLDRTTTVDYALSGDGQFGPSLYISGGICDRGPCGVRLPAGNYCVTVTASPESAIGSCGCFVLLMDTSDPDALFLNGFDAGTEQAAATQRY